MNVCSPAVHAHTPGVALASKGSILCNHPSPGATLASGREPGPRSPRARRALRAPALSVARRRATASTRPALSGTRAVRRVCAPPAPSCQAAPASCPRAAHAWARPARARRAAAPTRARGMKCVWACARLAARTTAAAAAPAASVTTRRRAQALAPRYAKWGRGACPRARVRQLGLALGVCAATTKPSCRGHTRGSLTHAHPHPNPPTPLPPPPPPPPPVWFKRHDRRHGRKPVHVHHHWADVEPPDQLVRVPGWPDSVQRGRLPPDKWPAMHVGQPVCKRQLQRRRQRRVRRLVQVRLRARSILFLVCA